MRTPRPADDAAPASASGSSPANDELAHLNGYLVLRPREELLAQHVPVLLLPLLGEEVDDGVMAREELIPVAPNAIRCIRLRGNGSAYPPFTSSFSWRHIHEGQIAVTARPRQDRALARPSMPRSIAETVCRRASPSLRCAGHAYSRGSALSSPGHKLSSPFKTPSSLLTLARAVSSVKGGTRGPEDIVVCIEVQRPSCFAIDPRGKNALDTDSHVEPRIYMLSLLTHV